MENMKLSPNELEALKELGDNLKRIADVMLHTSRRILDMLTDIANRHQHETRCAQHTPQEYNQSKDPVPSGPNGEGSTGRYPFFFPPNAGIPNIGDVESPPIITIPFPITYREFKLPNILCEYIPRIPLTEEVRQKARERYKALLERVLKRQQEQQEKQLQIQSNIQATIGILDPNSYTNVSIVAHYNKPNECGEIFANNADADDDLPKPDCIIPGNE